MQLGTKRFVLARFESNIFCTFACRKQKRSKSYKIVRKNDDKICIYQIFFVPLCRLFGDKTYFETYQRINLIDKSGRFISSQGR